MKVLYVGNYRDESGWAQFSQRQILALDAAGIDVTTRCIKLNKVEGTVPERLLELENKRGDNFDIVIQNVLPHYSEYNGHFKKNILYYMCETSNFISSTWAEHINLMDEGWVPSQHNKVASVDSGVEVPVNVIPTAIDLEQFKSPPSPLPLRDRLRDDFVFYTIGEFTARKNLGALLKAFHLEFDKSEPVQLLIKTSPNGLGNNHHENIQNYINNIKTGLKLSTKLEDYKQEIVICEHSPRETIQSIHMTGDAFISTSRGEAWCLPAMDAVGYLRPVIVPRHTGFLEYLNRDTAWLTDAYEDSVFGAIDTFGDLYTGRESWFETSVPDLRRNMRAVYENKMERTVRAEQARIRLEDFSFERVGEKMREVLFR